MDSIGSKRQQTGHGLKNSKGWTCDIIAIDWIKRVFDPATREKTNDACHLRWKRKLRNLNGQMHTGLLDLKR